MQRILWRQKLCNQHVVCGHREGGQSKILKWSHRRVSRHDRRSCYLRGQKLPIDIDRQQVLQAKKQNIFIKKSVEVENMYILQEMKWVLNLIWHGLWKKEKMPLFSANKIFLQASSEEGVKITQIGQFHKWKIERFWF